MQLASSPHKLALYISGVAMQQETGASKSWAVISGFILPARSGNTLSAYIIVTGILELKIELLRHIQTAKVGLNANEASPS